MNNQNRVDNVEEYHEKLAAYDQCNKLDIVFWTDAVVKPFAMVIKELNTTVAFVAMEWPLTSATLA